MSLDAADGSGNRRRSSSLFKLADLLPSTNAVALPSYVVDLSEKENLTLFKSLLEAGTSGDITFTLLLSCRSYGKKRPTAKWRNASQYCTSSTPLCKEQLKVLKIKTGSDFTKMDPDGLVSTKMLLRESEAEWWEKIEVSFSLLTKNHFVFLFVA